MGCSDVSEFEHIYGHLVCTADCLHEQEWWILIRSCIVWKTFIDIFLDKVKSLGINSCLYEIPKNDLIDDMKLWPPVTSPDAGT